MERFDSVDSVKRGHSLAEILRKRGTSLSEQMFELGEKLSKHVDLAEWAAWMVQAEAKNYPDKVIFTFPNAFHRDYASMRLSHGLQEYFKKPVMMVVR